jgi:retron-type reverse transcriptase
VNEAYQIAKRKILADNTLHERTYLAVDEIVDLLQLCLSSTCFLWRGEYYEQTSKAAMGSPLSPILANLFMEDFEEKALSNSPFTTKLWKRYVDDILSIWSHGKESHTTFLNYLNSIHPAIMFTMEIEN